MYVLRFIFISPQTTETGAVGTIGIALKRNKTKSSRVPLFNFLDILSTSFSLTPINLPNFEITISSALSEI